MKVLIPLPDADFDTTEVAVPWHYLTQDGHEVVFATEGGGASPATDPRLLSGVLFGRLGARPEPLRMHRQMAASAEYAAPAAWADLDVAAFDGLILAGGHAPGMRQYLGSSLLRDKVAEFWRLDRPVGAICHGVLVLARTIDPSTGSSVIAKRFTTCLPKHMERSAYALTAWKLGRYYRTYPSYVEDEVRSVLDDQRRFVRGPRTISRRGTDVDDRPAFVLRDGNYLSARWPGDAYLFARSFLRVLAGS
ncbi:MAG: type 1 glutamine amidotransferase domain-containing protein [Acidimicrobiales bacterium]